MESKRQLAFVGLFVLLAGALLLVTVLALSGVFGGSGASYRAYFAFAGGLEPGASVRYAGGPQVGRVESLQLDPTSLTRIEVTFRVRSGLPIKTDSHVRIAALSLLAENYLEIVPGSEHADPATPGMVLPSEPYSDLSSLAPTLTELAPPAQQLLKTLNDSAAGLKITLERVNELVSDENRARFASTLAEVHGLVAENRAPVRSAVQNLNATIQKLEPLFQDLHNNSVRLNETLDHLDSLVGENRADARQAVIDLRQSLANLTALTQRLDHTLDANSENLDDLLENLRHVSQNLKEFTNTIKNRPSTLIRSSGPREHVPGESQ